MSIGITTNLGHYIGFQMVYGHVTKSHFDHVVDSVEKHLSYWKGKLLSHINVPNELLGLKGSNVVKAIHLAYMELCEGYWLRLGNGSSNFWFVLWMHDMFISSKAPYVHISLRVLREGLNLSVDLKGGHLKGGHVGNFLWQACCGALPTRSFLHARQLVVDPMRARCNCGNDDILHVLLHCDNALRIWH
ncbi:hypothetical protein VNO78_10463 [Psophocarpus tetragonolobus]|uniref:Reverse transcriptase zinc-binding domain-containing protein n=1 Tax=Psophocarpus tetragonolobus TaxID=3891 RepID=A0AAN9SK44_PSOTE